MSHWQVPSCLDLGNLKADYPLKTTLTLQVPQAASLHSDLSGLEIWPHSLPQAGQYTLHLALPKLKPDTLLAGQLILTTATESQTVWIIGRVLAAHDPLEASNALPTIDLTPHMLDFGQLKSTAHLPMLTVIGRNNGTETWQATLQALVPWLTLDRLMVRCAPQQPFEFTVHLNREAYDLPLGQTKIKTAIQLLNPNGTAFTVAVQLERVAS